jgi:hypothetical protein
MVAFRSNGVETMNKAILLAAVAALALLSSTVSVAQQADTDAQAERHAHAAHGAAPELAEGQRWATDAPLREAMLRIRNAVAAHTAAFHEGALSADEAQALATAVDADVQFMIANCRLAPEPDAALHALIGRMLGAAEALRADPAAPDGMPELVSVLRDYGARFDHPGWEAL